MLEGVFNVSKIRLLHETGATMTRKLKLIGIFATVLMLAATAFAALTGDIEGTVYDPSGALVQGAKVTVRSLTTGTVRTTTTDAQGGFAVLQLELGEYSVTVEKSGFGLLTMRAFVRSGEKTRLSANLALGATSEAVTVEGTAPTLDVNTSQVSSAIPYQEVEALPNSARDPVSLATLSPGTVPVSKDNPFLGSGSFNSNGSRGRANNITIDNITSTDISTTGNSGLGTISFEAIQEVKIITNNFSAEFGRNSGSQVQIITKSGTNQYHGSIYWLHQNAYFNARDYFDTSGSATPLRQNTWGFYVGGPIIKNKLWVSGHYEGFRNRGAGSTQRATVMTPTDIANITNATSKAVVVANQYPTSPTGTLNSPGPNAANAFSYSVRVDANTRGGRDLWSMNYGENPATSIRPGLVFIFTSLPNYGASSTNAARKARLAETHTFTTTLVNQFNFAYGRSRPTFPIATTVSAPYPPEILIGGVDGFGLWSGLPQGRIQNIFQWSDTVSWSKGRHQFKFGGDYDYYQANSIFDSNLRGTASFASVAAFQAGQLLQYTQRFGNSQRYNLSHDIFAFAQDDIRVTPNLTLNLGVRLESSGGVSEKFNVLANLDPTKTTVAVGGGGTGPLGAVDLGGQSFQRNNNWAPRLGFAYNPGHGKFVIRAGYGWAYDYIFLNPITNLRFSPPFMPSIALTSFTGTNTWANLYAGTAQAQTDAISAIGSFPLNQVNFGTLSPVDQHLKNPRNQQWTLSTEYQVTPTLVAKLSYVGAKTDFLQISMPLNLVNASVVPPPAISGADEVARLAAFAAVFGAENGNATGTLVNNRLDKRFNSVTQVQSTAESWYHSAQVDIIKQFSHGLAFGANYTWGHSEDTVSDSLGVLINDSAGIQDPRNPQSNKANSQYDIRHRVTMNYLWRVPFTRNMTGWMKKTFDGWGMAGIFYAQSGLPATVFAGTRRGISDILLDGNSTVIANGDTSQFHPVPLGHPAPWNPAPTLTAAQKTAFLCTRGVVSSGATLCPNTMGFPLTQPLLGNAGNSGRNSLRLPANSNLDWTFIKNTAITERVNLQFRWEIYNLLNHPNFAVMNNTLTSVNFGTFTTTATNMRQMQGGIKVTF
jgi:carboxypeptidase family protein